jgi:hypothetical protein
MPSLGCEFKVHEHSGDISMKTNMKIIKLNLFLKFSKNKFRRFMTRTNHTLSPLHADNSSSHFYGTRSLIKSSHWIISQDRVQSQSTHLHPIYFRLIFVLSSHLQPDCPSGLSSSSFSTKISYSPNQGLPYSRGTRSFVAIACTVLIYTIALSSTQIVLTAGRIRRQFNPIYFFPSVYDRHVYL